MAASPAINLDFSRYSVILVVIIFVCYINSLQCGFVFDDLSAIIDNQDLRPHVPLSNLFWNDFWGTPMNKEDSHKSYRPLCVLTFRLNYALTALNPMSYHLVNIILHAVVSVLLMRVCCLFLHRFTALLAAVLFALHPIHTEAVTGVVGRAESLSACFFLAALLVYAKASKHPSRTNWWFLLLTLLFVVAAMLSKEQGITVVGVCCVYEIVIAQKITPQNILKDFANICKGKISFPAWLRTSVLRGTFLVGSTLFLLLARIKIMGAELPVFTKFDNPASVSYTPCRQLTFNYLLAVNQWLLLCPSWLCCDWTMGTVPLVQSFLDIRNLSTLIFYIVLFKFVAFALTKQGPRARAIIMSLTLLILPFVPASNLFFPVGFVVAERVLYTPSMGFCILVALGFELLIQHTNKTLKMVLWGLMVFLLTVHGLKTIIRNFDWESEYILFKSAVKVNQRNAKLFNNIGHALEKTSNWSEALEYFTFAAKVQPDDIGAHINVGRTYQHLNMSKEAEKAFQTAIDLFPPVIQGKSYTARVAPSHLNAFLNLASLISKNESRLKEAEKLYKSAITMRADYVKAYMSRGEVLVRLGRLEEAKEQYRIALHYEQSDADIYYNIGVVNLEQKNLLEANTFFEQALRLNPDHQQTLFNSALLLQDLGNPVYRPEAMRRLLHLLELKPNDAKAYYCLAILAADNKEFIKAKNWFQEAIRLEDTMRSALFNLALMLVNDLKQPHEAVPYLQKLLMYYPNHTKGLILMGDININILKDLNSAEKNFLTILKNEPGNVQAIHNLCVVYVERGDILKAEKCLQHAHSLAPSESYILQHLNIVRNKIKSIKAKKKPQ
ncbi:protein O-mannosyl-transferase TMTC3 isoform X2 [Octopus bimaculoides]|nr:protein O-mannosyl-transferase TMTC3 isoform X2 [Octopus bimaculoides]